MRVQIKYGDKWYSGSIENILQNKRNGIGVQCDGEKKGILTWRIPANVRALYSKGDRVSYVKDGVRRPATVIAVDNSIMPRSYSIKFKDDGHTHSTESTYLEFDDDDV